jgi:hypothetical protein
MLRAKIQRNVESRNKPFENLKNIHPKLIISLKDSVGFPKMCKFVA